MKLSNWYNYKSKMNKLKRESERAMRWVDCTILLSGPGLVPTTIKSLRKKKVTCQKEVDNILFWLVPDSFFNDNLGRAEEGYLYCVLDLFIYFWPILYIAKVCFKITEYVGFDIRRGEVKDEKIEMPQC